MAARNLPRLSAFPQGLGFTGLRFIDPPKNLKLGRFQVGSQQTGTVAYIGTLGLISVSYVSLIRGNYPPLSLDLPQTLNPETLSLDWFGGRKGLYGVICHKVWG